MAKRKINYEAFKGGEVFFSSAKGFYPWLIRATTIGWRKRHSLKVCNHAGIISESWGQFFACEMGADGLRETSFEKYRNTKKNRLVAVYRWKRSEEDSTTWIKINSALSLLRRQTVGYSMWGAIQSSKLGKKLFGWTKVKNERDFCSENTFLVLKKAGLDDYPLMWEKEPPNPYELYLWVKNNENFIEVEPYLC